MFSGFRRTGSLKLSLRPADEWIILPSCSNTRRPASVNTGSLIRIKTGSWFTILRQKILETIPSPIQSKLGSMMILRSISALLRFDRNKPAAPYQYGRSGGPVFSFPIQNKTVLQISCPGRCTGSAPAWQWG